MLLAETLFCVLDTETTGKDPERDRVCQLGAVWVQGGHLLHEFLSYVDPERPIPPEASAIHHITSRHIQEFEAPPLSVAWEDFWEGHRGQEAHCFVAHNAKFDFGFLPEINKPTLCTMRLAKKLWVAKHYSNQYLRYALHLDIPYSYSGPAHDALCDAGVTACLLVKELQDLEADHGIRDLETLLEWIKGPILLDLCPFHKYNGKPWDKVPTGYLEWTLNNREDLDEDIVYTINYHLDRR